MTIDPEALRRAIDALARGEDENAHVANVVEAAKAYLKNVAPPPPVDKTWLVELTADARMYTKVRVVAPDEETAKERALAARSDDTLTWTCFRLDLDSVVENGVELVGGGT